MKHNNNRTAVRLTRALIIGAASATLILAHTSCLGLGKKDSNDGARIEDDEPKKKRGSLFARAKNRNGWIDEDIQTTRRDRYAAQNNMDFTLTNPEVDPTPTPTPTPAQNPAPLTPNNPIDLEPDPTIGAENPLAVARPSVPSDPPLRLPTSLDDDFPQPNQPTPAPDPTPSRPVADEDGYIPLQPKLPRAESIEEPPTE